MDSKTSTVKALHKYIRIYAYTYMLLYALQNGRGG
jgi:hypothetical protein